MDAYASVWERAHGRERLSSWPPQGRNVCLLCPPVNLAWSKLFQQTHLLVITHQWRAVPSCTALHGTALQVMSRGIETASRVVEDKVSPWSFPPSHFCVLAHAAHPSSTRQRRSRNLARWGTVKQIRQKKVHVKVGSASDPPAALLKSCFFFD
jgi:hypothetical protein